MNTSASYNIRMWLMSFRNTIYESGIWAYPEISHKHSILSFFYCKQIPHFHAVTPDNSPKIIHAGSPVIRHIAE